MANKRSLERNKFVREHQNRVYRNAYPDIWFLFICQHGSDDIKMKNSTFHLGGECARAHTRTNTQHIIAVGCCSLGSVVWPPFHMNGREWVHEYFYEWNGVEQQKARIVCLIGVCFCLHVRSRFYCHWSDLMSVQCIYFVCCVCVCIVQCAVC